MIISLKENENYIFKIIIYINWNIFLVIDIKKINDVYFIENIKIEIIEIIILIKIISIEMIMNLLIEFVDEKEIYKKDYILISLL